MDKKKIISKREECMRDMRYEKSNISYYELLNPLEALEAKEDKIKELKLEILKLNKIFIRDDLNFLETEERILEICKSKNEDGILELDIGDLKDNYWYEVLIADKNGIFTYVTRFKEEIFLEERESRPGYIASRYSKNNIYILMEEDGVWFRRRHECDGK